MRRHSSPSEKQDCCLLKNPVLILFVTLPSYFLSSGTYCCYTRATHTQCVGTEFPRMVNPMTSVGRLSNQMGEWSSSPLQAAIDTTRAATSARPAAACWPRGRHRLTWGSLTAGRHSTEFLNVTVSPSCDGTKFSWLYGGEIILGQRLFLAENSEILIFAIS